MDKERRDTIRRQLDGQNKQAFARSSLTADEARELLDAADEAASAPEAGREPPQDEALEALDTIEKCVYACVPDHVTTYLDFDVIYQALRERRDDTYRINKIEAQDEALKPCPFCGGKAEIKRDEECAIAQCLTTSAHRLIVDGDNNAAKEVAALWNERAIKSAEGSDNE